jgi:hypothetical protein
MNETFRTSPENGKPARRGARGYIEDYRPQERTLDLLRQVDSVLEEYEDYWPLTLRQMFYRLVGAHGYDKSEKAYKRLGEHLANARRARWIPFEAIRDDGVSTLHYDQFAGRDEFIRHVREQGENYRRNILADQPVHIEAWCEAGGMLPQLAAVAQPYSVQVYSSGGFDSLTAKKRLADRIVAIGKPTVILHLGDYDPSGEGIFAAMAEDVAAFVEADRRHGYTSVDFKRIALTDGQVAAYDLPTAPPKASDSRARRWTGETCQLEALAPDEIARLLRNAILAEIDDSLLFQTRLEEALEREEITRLLLPGTTTQEGGA